jgi:hypothetical protein
MSINNFEISTEDFEQQPRGPFLSNYWIAKQRVPTPLGDFSVEARTPLNDPQPPDERMLEQVNTVATFVLANPDKILDKVYEHYQLVSKQSEWMQDCDVPTDLSRDGLAPYMVRLNIVTDREEPEPTIYVVPQWDEEHAIYLTVQDGRVEFQDM